jgi:hypothetical protein
MFDPFLRLPPALAYAMVAFARRWPVNRPVVVCLACSSALVFVVFSLRAMVVEEVSKQLVARSGSASISRAAASLTVLGVLVGVFQMLLLAGRLSEQRKAERIGLIRLGVPEESIIRTVLIEQLAFGLVGGVAGGLGGLGLVALISRSSAFVCPRGQDIGLALLLTVVAPFISLAPVVVGETWSLRHLSARSLREIE